MTNLRREPNTCFVSLMGRLQEAKAKLQQQVLRWTVFATILVEFSFFKITEDEKP